MANRSLPLAALLLTASVASSAPPPATPPLDPESHAPYQWRVVVRFDPHPALNPEFRRQITADVKAALQPPLGEVGRVEVADLDAVPPEKRDPLTKLFAEKGWAALESAEAHAITGVKTHFLHVAAADGGYKLEARQHDGSTGLNSPLVRVKETRAPDLVARLAGMMLARDFGPVGTVEKIANEPGAVRVRFRGGALPGFDRFVKPGDVFAVAVIREETRRAPNAPPPKAEKMPRYGRGKPEGTVTVRVGQSREFTLLRAEGPVSGGECKCQVLTRYAAPFPTGRGVVGVRCLKLATVEGPVEVRVVDPDGRPQTAGQLLQVRATDGDFSTPADLRDALELRDGLFRSPRPLRNVACVVVSLGAGKQEQFPIPVLGEGPVTLRFNAKPEDAVKAAFERACEDLRGRVAEARLAQLELVRALSRLIIQGKNKDALERASDGLQSLDAADKELTAELDKLKKEPGAKDPVPSSLLDAAGTQLQAIREGRGGIAQKQEELKNAVAKANDPVRFEKEFRAKELTDRIKQLVAQGEVPEALDLYDQLFEVTQNPEVKDQKAKLAAEWQPKNDEHRKAREYVIDEWRKAAGLAEFKAAVQPLTDAAGVLKKYDDRLGLRNLLSSFEPAYAKLKEVLDGLDPESDRASVKEVQAVSQALRQIEQDAREHLKKIESAGEKKP